MSTITMCANSANIVGEMFIGGIVGQISKGGSVNSCYNTGRIKATSKNGYGDACVGGIVGLLTTSNNISITISNCYNTGSIVTSYPLAGGILGCQASQSGNGLLYIKNCYSIGTVSGAQRIGSLVGYLHYASCSNSYVLTKPAVGSKATVTWDTQSRAVSATELKGMAPTLGSQFKTAPSNINQGFPILTWQ